MVFGSNGLVGVNTAIESDAVTVPSTWWESAGAKLARDVPEASTTEAVPRRVARVALAETADGVTVKLEDVTLEGSIGSENTACRTALRCT
jgi:hypothetical protein